MKWKVKLPLIFITLMGIIYVVLWLKITADLAAIVSDRMSNKIFSVIQGHRVKFTEVYPSGSPFVFEVELHGVTEDTPHALITHKNPVFIGYNLFSQELYMHYNGESIIETKPFKDNKILKSTGDFRYSLGVPINFSKIFESSTDTDVVNLFSNIHSINVHIRDSALENDEKLKIIDGRNFDINLKFNHHRKYTSLEEIVNDIPKDYEVKMRIFNTHSMSQEQSLPYSLVYGIHIPFNAQYTLTAAFHTGADKFVNIVNDFEVRNWQSTAVSDSEENESKINALANVSEDAGKVSWDSVSKFKLKTSYSKNLDTMIKTLLGLIPSSSYQLENASTFRRADIAAMDFAALNLDTKDDPVNIALKVDMNVGKNGDSAEIEVPHFGINFHNVSLDVKSKTKIDLYKDWSSEGVVSVVNFESLVKYIVDSYFTLHHISENGKFNSSFYTKMMSDFMHQIANSVSDTNGSMTIDYDLKSDVTASKIGKFTWPETTLLYYATLLKHLNMVSDEWEAMDKFKTLVPDYVLAPESLDKIILQSKGS